jgi:MoaA/NifB/PqqE/SkfB family radical SAM enzyme
MKIHNIRFGFATNSSSSHSIIFDPNHNRSDYDDDQFGWNYFTLASKESKDRYMASMLRQNLNSSMSKEFINLILKGMELPTGKKPKPDDEFDFEDGIDHQSVFTLPRDIKSNNISVEFFNEFLAYIRQPEIYIRGGNDNSDDDEERDTSKDVLVDGYGVCRDMGASLVCRKDGSWWTIYDTVSGNRIVHSFEKDPEPFAPKTPMLVDLKITDYCTSGCAFCYQGSTPAGNHADDEFISKIVHDLKAAKVFEVAIGGGEPTEYPRFVKLLKQLKDSNIVANFTTKSIEWLENERVANEVIANVGAFAYSASDTTSLDRILAIFNYRRYSISKFTVQIIPSVLNDYTLKSILKWCRTHHVRVTLLGFKETGRGKKFKDIAIARKWDKFDESKWIDIIKELVSEICCPVIAIDTTLAARYLSTLQEVGIPDYLYHTQEGRYSAYIDAVNKKFGPSSYHPEHLIDYADKNWGYAIKEMFSKIDPV